MGQMFIGNTFIFVLLLTSFINSLSSFVDIYTHIEEREDRREGVVGEGAVQGQGRAGLRS